MTFLAGVFAGVFAVFALYVIDQEIAERRMWKLWPFNK